MYISKIPLTDSINYHQTSKTFSVNFVYANDILMSAKTSFKISSILFHLKLSKIDTFLKFKFALTAKLEVKQKK